jgi:hypothetical protein
MAFRMGWVEVVRLMRNFPFAITLGKNCVPYSKHRIINFLHIHLARPQPFERTILPKVQQISYSTLYSTRDIDSKN